MCPLEMTVLRRPILSSAEATNCTLCRLCRLLILLTYLGELFLLAAAHRSPLRGAHLIPIKEKGAAVHYSESQLAPLYWLRLFQPHRKNKNGADTQPP